MSRSIRTSAAALPCPFCGSAPRIRRLPPMPPEIPNYFWIVECISMRDTCPAQVMVIEDTKAFAIEQWNRREEGRTIHAV